jgi:polyisoprenoid-binding protein YceI
MRRIVTIAIVGVLIGLAPRAWANTIHLTIDPKASKVTAAVAEPDRSKGSATGKFDITSGEVSGDPANPASAGTVNIVLDAKSYDSGNAFRDDAVFNLLDANNYLTITFQSTAVQDVAMSSSNAGSATLSGNLTIHGTTKQVSVPVKAALDGAGSLTADGEITFNYADYRVKVPSILGKQAGDEVRVTFHIVAVPAKAGS